ncbi:MAG: glycosyltransferase [Syntrophales bacterium]|nr:glycosyltransferase [Syntrophales bacterium]
MRHIQSQLALCKTFLKRRLSNPLLYPVYQITRKYLSRNRIFILYKRSLLKRKGYLNPPPFTGTGNNQITNAGDRPNSIPMLLKGKKAAVPLTIGFIITENHPSTIYGDYFTAHGLGDELEKLGYRVVYLPERPIYEWHHLSSVDILVVMIHSFDPVLLRQYPGIISVAWIRGYVDEWCRAPWFKEYDIILTTSEISLQYAKRFTDPGKCLAVLRLAADTNIFTPGPCRPEYESDISFVGNIFEAPREFTRKLTIEPGITFSLYGQMTETGHPFRKYHRGKVSHGDIPMIYNSSRIVLEDCTPMCRPWGCINSRTFEAMACGACVVSNEVPGLKELFGDAIITYKSRKDLNSTISWLLRNGEKRKNIGIRAREKIVQQHTYKHRAEEFRQALFRHFGTVPPETG